MQTTYSSFLLTSLLVTGIATQALQFGSQLQKVSSYEAQSHPFAQLATDEVDCPKSGESPLPGCGRRDKGLTK
jgi:hypothetical protein